MSKCEGEGQEKPLRERLGDYEDFLCETEQRETTTVTSEQSVDPASVSQHASWSVCLSVCVSVCVCLCVSLCVSLSVCLCVRYLVVQAQQQDAVHLLLLFGLQLLDEEEDLPPLRPAQSRRLHRQTLRQVGQRVEAAGGLREEGLTH